MNKKLSEFKVGRSYCNRRVSRTPMKRECDVYIAVKSSFKAQLKECEDLLHSGINSIYLHCLGNAINRGINLALNLVKGSNGSISYAINTSTITLIDDIKSLTDDDDLHCFQRNNSSLHINVFKNAQINKN